MSVSYSTLLKTNKNFNKLFYGQTLSVLGGLVPYGSFINICLQHNGIAVYDRTYFYK